MTKPRRLSVVALNVRIYRDTRTYSVSRTVVLLRWDEFVARGGSVREFIRVAGFAGGFHGFEGRRRVRRPVRPGNGLAN